MPSEAQFVPILPAFDKFFAEVGKGAEKGGREAGTTFAAAMEKAVTKAEGAVEKATLQVERARDRQATAAEKTRLMELKLQETLEKQSSTASQIQKAQNDLAKARREQAENDKAADRAAKKLSDAQDDLNKKTREAADATSELSEKQTKAKESAEFFSLSLDKTKLAFAAISGAAGAAGGALFKMGATFDDAFDAIRIGTGATGENLEGLENSARNLARSVPSSFEDIGTAVADINTRLGLTGEPLEEFAAGMLQLENMGVDADINSVSAALNGFGVQAADMPHALDELFQVSQATGLTVTELADAAVKAGPSLRGFGFSMADSAALAGQMDKAGLDAGKTLQSMQRGLAEFAKEGRDAPTALKETVSAIGDLVAAGDDAGAINMAAKLFGTRGAATFVDAVKSGTLSVEDFMAATGATDDTIVGLADETADAAEAWQLFKNQALLAIEPVATAVFNALTPAIEEASTAFQEFMEWVTGTLIPTMQIVKDWFDQHVGAIAAVAGPLGVLTAAFAALVLQQKIAMAGGFLKWLQTLSAVQQVQAAVTKVATGAQAAFNLVMNANPIFLVVTAITALIAGLAIFFTKTETGRALWAAFTDAVSQGVDWLTEKFAQFKEWFAPVWEDIKTAPAAAFDWVKNAALDLWNNGIALVIEWIKAGWQTLTDLSNAGRDIIVGVLNGIRDVAIAIWDGALRPIVDAIAAAWDWLTGTLTAGAQLIVAGALWLLHREVNGLKVVWDIVTGAISAAWDWLTGSLRAGAEFIRNTVFGALHRGLQKVQDAFAAVTHAIGVIWDGIREKTRRPVEFVVNTVYNNGIRRAWNAVGKLVGLDELPEYHFATGGVLPGYTPGRDIYRFIDPVTGTAIDLGGGEGILRPEVTREVGPAWIDGINAAARMGGRSAVRRFLGAFAGGGVIGSIVNLVKEKFPMMTITSTFRPGARDWHGQGKAVDFSNGTDDTPDMQRAAGWFAANYGADLLELIHSPFNANVKNGRNVGDGMAFYGAATMAGHRNHVHVAAANPLAGGGGNGLMGAIATGLSYIGDMLTSTWDRIVAPIKAAIPPLGGIIGKLPAAVLDKLGSAALDFLKKKSPAADATGAYTGPVAAGVEQWRGLVEHVLSAKGFPTSLADTVLRRMNQESGGNPRAINNWDSNAAAGVPSKGLMQVIDPTFAANADPGYTNIWDPEANLRASMNYAIRRYGSLPAAYNRAGGYKDGGVVPKLFDTGGWLNPGDIAVNALGTPEPVLTPSHWSIIEKLVSEMAKIAPPLAAAAKTLATTFPADAARAGAYAQAFLTSGDVKTITETFSKLPTLATFLDPVKGVINSLDTVGTKWAAHRSALDDVAEKTDALKAAQKALADAQAQSADMTREDAEKIAEAEKALADARAAATTGDDPAAADKVTEAEEKLKKARADAAAHAGDAEKKRADEIKKASDAVLKAEGDLSAARHAAADVARAAGQAEIAAAIEVINAVIDTVGKIAGAITSARLAVATGVKNMMDAIVQTAGIVASLRADVIKTSTAYIAAQIDVAAAAREARFTQVSGALATLAAATNVEEARAKFNATRRADLGALMALYQDLTVDTDTWKTAIAAAADAATTGAAEWSDATRADFATLQAAEAELTLSEMKAKKDNLAASRKQEAAAISLALSSLDLTTATEKLSQTLDATSGTTKLEATVGQRYAELAEELASIEATKWDPKTWLNPANWFGRYDDFDRRQADIRAEMAQIEAMPEFKHTVNAADLKDITTRAGALGFFGASDQVADMVKNSTLGDAARTLDRIKFKNEVTDLKTAPTRDTLELRKEIADFNAKIADQSAEYELRAAELDRDAKKTWAKYWSTQDAAVRSQLERTAKYQEDAAAEFHAAADKQVNLTIQIPADVEAITVDQLKTIAAELKKNQAALTLRVDQIENPRPGAATVAERIRG